MKIVIATFLLVTLALANKQKPEPSCPVMSGEWLENFSVNMMDP